MVVLVAGVVLKSLLYRYWQLAAGRQLAAQNFGDGLSTLLSRVPCHEHSLYFVEPRLEGYASSGVHYDHHVGVLCGQAGYHLLLELRQFERTVKAFALDTAVESGAIYHVVGLAHALHQLLFVKFFEADFYVGRRYVVKIFHHDVVPHAAFHLQRQLAERVGVVAPVACHGLAVHLYAVAVVASDVYFQRLVSLRSVASAPTHAESVGGETVHRAAIFPVEVHLRVNPHYVGRALQSLVLEVFAAETLGLHSRVGEHLVGDVVINHVVRKHYGLLVHLFQSLAHGR